MAHGHLRRVPCGRAVGDEEGLALVGAVAAVAAGVGVAVVGGDDDQPVLGAVLATPREALLIGTPPALPRLLLHRRSLDAGGRPLEQVRTLYRGDRFSFTLALGAPPAG